MSQSIDFGGKNFISAKDAAKLVGYVPDYVGQLARGGKVEAKMVGRSWFVSRESILKHRDLTVSAGATARLPHTPAESYAPLAHHAPSSASLASVAESVHRQTDVSDVGAHSLVHEIVYERDEMPLLPAGRHSAPRLARFLVDPETRMLAASTGHSLVPLLSKIGTLVSPALIQKATALAASSALVFGAYALADNETLPRTIAIAASAARAAVEFSPRAALAAASDFAHRVPSYAAAGAEAFAFRAADSVGRAVSSVRAVEEVVRSFAYEPSDAAHAAVAGQERGTTNFARALARAFFRGVNLLAQDAGRTLLSVFGAPVPPTGLAVVPTPAPRAEQVLPPAPATSPRDTSFVAAAERVTTSERVVERIIVGEVSRAELNEKLSILNNKLSSEIYKISADGARTAASVTNVYQTVAHTNKIDQLRTVDIFTPMISGGSIRSMESIGATDGGFTTLTATTLTVGGALSVTATSTLSSGLVVDTNTLFVDPANNRVGIGTTSPQYALDVDGVLRATSLLVSGQTVGADFSVSGNTTLSGNITLGDATTTDITYFNSKIGSSLVPTADNAIDLGSTSPWARFRSLFLGTSVGIGGTATSTGSQLTASGAYLIDTVGALSLNTTNNATTTFGTGVTSFAGNVGIGTTTPGTLLSLQSIANFAPATSTFYGDLRFNALVATSTTATSTIAGFLDVTGTGTNATSSFAGGIKTVGLSSSNGITLTGGILRTTANAATSTVFDTPFWVENSTATSTTLGGFQAKSLLSQNGLTLTGGSIRSSAADLDIFAGGGNDILLNSSGGNVGIGTTNPGAALSVVGAGRFTTDLDLYGGDMNIGTGSATTTLTSLNENLGLASTSPWALFSLAPVPTRSVNTPSFAISTTTPVGGGTATSTAFLIAQSGYAGIGGTTTPAALLSLEARSLATTPLFLVSTSTATATSTAFTIDSQGRVGIGTTSPGTPLSLQGVGNFASATSTLYGGLSAADLRLTTGGLTLAGGILRTTANAATSTVFDTPFWVENSTATSTTLGGFQAKSLLSQNGLTLAGGSIRSSAADLDIFAGGGNDILLNSSGGNVGIGTTTPTELLNIVGSSNSRILLTSNVASGNSTLRLQRSRGTPTAPTDVASGDYVAQFAGGGFLNGTYYDAASIDFLLDGTPGVSDMPGRIDFRVSQDGTDTLGVTAMTIKNTGNIGIGTTTPSNLLSVYSATAATMGFTGGNAKDVWSMGYDVTNNRFAIASSSTITTNVRMVINGNGNVGIGTAAPNSKLEVADEIITTDTAGFRFYAAGGLRGGLFFGDAGTPGSDNGNVLLSSEGNQNLFFGTDTANAQMTLQGSTGKFGIGTTSPQSRLGVEQSADTELGGLTLAATGDNDYRAMFMNTSGVLSFTGGDAPTFNTATLTAGGVWTDAPSFSWLKSDREVLSREELVEILEGTNIEKFKIIAEGEGGDTHIGIVLDEADPRLASHNAEGEIVGYSPMRVASVAFAGVREIFGAMSIDANGNIGVGTSTPEYKLHVMGDVAATSFVNISTRTAKKDIEYYDDGDKRSILDKIKNVGIAEYRYSGESESAPLRLGLIAEEAPAEVLSASGKGVDVYKLSTFILVGVQELQKRIEGVELRLAKLEEMVANTTLVTGGFSLADALTGLKDLVVESLTARKKLCVDDVCVDKEQFKQLLASAGVSTTGTATSTAASGDTEAPVITLNGNNPATIPLNALYADLGASVSDNTDHNLGVKASLDGEQWIEIGNLSLNTASSTTYTIQYRAVDNAGNVGTAERVVMVGNPDANVANEESAPASPTEKQPAESEFAPTPEPTPSSTSEPTAETPAPETP